MTRLTKQELEAQLKHTRDELDKLSTPPVTPPVVTTPPIETLPIETNPTPIVTPKPVEEVNKDVIPEEKKDVVPPVTPPVVTTPEEKPVDQSKKPDGTDWRKRYVDSTRQAQTLYKSNQEVNKAIADGEAMVLPSDEECKAQYSEWDDMDDIQKRFIREGLRDRKRFDLIAKALHNVQSTQAWHGKVDKYITDPRTILAFPELEDKQDEFRVYASDKEGIVTDLNYLVPAFLAELANKKPIPKKTKMFETGVPGKVIKPANSGKISYEQSVILRKTDYKAWKKLLIAHKIENPVDSL